MFPYFILGIAVLVGGLLIARWGVNAKPKAFAKLVLWILLVLIIGVVILMATSGRLGWAFGAAMAMVPWIMRFRALARTAKNFSRMASGSPGDGNSTVNTRFIRMELDHRTGAMSGTVLEGDFEGRDLGNMTLEDLLDLMRTCLADDAPSAQVLEAYLDRNHDDWRARAGADGSSGRPAPDNTRMDDDEAWQVLGLEPGASQDDIKKAHHRLMAALHPDHGGSGYLASKINQARDRLLKNA